MCYLHKSTKQSDADYRTQHGVGSANAGNANYAADYIDHPISFTVEEAPTEEEAFWPYSSGYGLREVRASPVSRS